MIRLGIPSKGRLKKQVEKFFFEKGLELVNVGTSREYLAEFKEEKKILICGFGVGLSASIILFYR